MSTALLVFIACLLLTAALASPAPQPAEPAVLHAETFRDYVDAFSAGDEELYTGAIANDAAWPFLRDNVPLFECPDKTLEEVYYFRWWIYRKHIRQTPDGFIITEFLPDVDWAGKHNSINCAAAHHFYEGRWLRDGRYLDDYAVFWLRRGGSLRSYSFWIADSLWSRYLVTGDLRQVKELLPDLVANYREWEQSHLGAEGLFWQIDDRDGMEMSVGGNGCKPGYRPTINSYMYADAEAIASIAELVGQADLADEFRVKAAEIKRLVQERLWDDDARFFKVLPVEPGSQLVDVREQIGYTPWYVNLPDPGFEDAWKQLMDPDGFYAPHGPTTCERRHPGFKLDYEGHECQWNGPSWPYSTSVTLTAMANLLNHYQQDFVDKRDYFDILGIYAGAQHLTREDGTVVPWIDENLNPLTGDWIARTVLKSRANTIPERGKDYNHSTFCDLVISGLVGLRPRPDDTVEVNPLVPDDTWDWFCLDGLPYHGHTLTVLYDRTGERYGRGKGLRILADGRQIAESPTLGRLTGKLPPLHSLTEEEKDIMAGHPPADPQVRQPSGAETSGGWAKHPGNPVLGGDMGTCFDVSVLKEADTFRMWFSWRPKDSIALVESRDGINWSEPTIVLGPAPTGWEDGVNRPVVVKRSDGYHMWYTGQVWHSDRHGRSCLGCATSPDGREWSRVSAKPVLSPDLPWENEAVMNPSVIWDEAANQFRMWYCGGEQWEPNAVGHATSPDGLVWTRLQDTPVFQSDPSIAWEHDRVAGCQVVRQGNWHLLFYIGYRDIDHAQIGLARSRDGISGWERHPGNPIIRPGRDKWDHDACYKPYALLDSGRWLLWYNGRHADLEQIGLAIHEGVDLGFGD